ncbi:unnamed protein product [Closterium sp. NIES-53]
MLLGTRAQWAHERPPPCAEADAASASLRNLHNEGDCSNVASVGCTRVTRRVIRAVNVGGMHAQVQRSMAAAGSSYCDVDGQRRSPQWSGVEPILVTHVSAGRDGGIAPAYGYFKFSPDKIAVPKPHEG